jgi:hypothetical protein
MPLIRRSMTILPFRDIQSEQLTASLHEPPINIQQEILLSRRERKLGLRRDNGFDQDGLYRLKLQTEAVASCGGGICNLETDPPH